MATSADTLELLGLSPALGRILRFYFARPEARTHQRALQRMLDLGSASVQRELERLQQLGVLESEKEGVRVVYTVIQDSPEWLALRELQATSRDLVPLLRDALVDVEGVMAAFVFGSVARGTHREDSDVDLFVLEGPDFDRRRFYLQLTEVGLLVDRRVNPIRYTPLELGERLGNASHPSRGFLREVLGGEKLWIAGSPSALGPIIAAAGLTREAHAVEVEQI